MGRPANDEFDAKVFIAKVGAGKTILEFRKNQHIFKQGDVAIYDAPNGPVCSETMHGELAAYLALLHIAGPMAQGAFYPDSKLTTSPPGTRPHHICANICAARQPDCLPAASNRFSVGDVTDTKANGK